MANPCPRGDLWLRSDLRRAVQPAASPAQPLPRPSRWLAVPRKPLTWILTGVMLLTSAAAGQAYLAAEPATGANRLVSSTATSGKPEEPSAQPVNLQSLAQLSATQQTLATELGQLRDSNLDLLDRLGKLQASFAPDVADHSTH